MSARRNRTRLSLPHHLQNLFRSLGAGIRSAGFGLVVGAYGGPGRRDCRANSSLAGLAWLPGLRRLRLVVVVFIVRALVVIVGIGCGCVRRAGRLRLAHRIQDLRTERLGPHPASWHDCRRLRRLEHRNIRRGLNLSPIACFTVSVTLATAFGSDNEPTIT